MLRLGGEVLSHKLQVFDLVFVYKNGKCRFPSGVLDIALGGKVCVENCLCALISSTVWALSSTMQMLRMS